MNNTSWFWLKLISIFLTVGVIVVGILQFTKTTTNTARIDINLTQPGPAPPPQFEYLQVDPGSPEFMPLPPGVYPPDYYRCPQFFFYYEPHSYFYRPGISIFIGCGWWYTPGVGMINIGFYGPTRPFPHNEHCRVVRTTTNISNNHTTINITKINNVNPSNPNRPPAPPHPSDPNHPNHPNNPHVQPPHKDPPHKDPPKPPPHKDPPHVPPPHKDPPRVEPPHNPPPPNPPPKVDPKKKKE